MEEINKDARDVLEQKPRSNKQEMTPEMAHNLLRLGIEMERIIKASGLSEEEIRRNIGNNQ